MTDTSFQTGGDEDLPRTVRQQKEARARDQMAREILNTPRAAFGATTGTRAGAASSISHLDTDYRGGEFPSHPTSPPGEYPLTTVSRLQIPFLHMVGFFLKAVVAAIPALLLLTLILWAGGQFAKHFMPWLVQAQINITFPK